MIDLKMLDESGLDIEITKDVGGCYEWTIKVKGTIEDLYSDRTFILYVCTCDDSLEEVVDLFQADYQEQIDKCIAYFNEPVTPDEL